MSVYLFEAGGTKTTLLVHTNGKTEKFDLPGYNPNRGGDQFAKSLLEISHPVESDEIFFYGSGLATLQNQDLVRSLFQQHFNVTPIVHSDLLGAARALQWNVEGAIGILGTGAVMAWYDGVDIVEKQGGHGYLIDDLGGGYELGKWFVSLWLNDSTYVSRLIPEIEEHFQCSRQEFIAKYYQDKDIATIASLSKVIEKWKENEIIHWQLMDYFETAFKRHLYPLLEKHQSKKIALVGSIAFNFQEVIRNSLSHNKIELEKVIQHPGEELLRFHLEKF